MKEIKPIPVSQLSTIQLAEQYPEIKKTYAYQLAVIGEQIEECKKALAIAIYQYLHDNKLRF